MLWIVCILIGLTLGQHIKLTVSPELSAFFRLTWALAHEKAPVIKGSATVAARHIKSAVKTKANPKTAPIQIFEITEGGETV